MCASDALQMEVHDCFDRLDRAAWSAIRDVDNVSTDCAFVKAAEESHVVECAHRYFEFREAGRLVCTMSGAVLVNDLVMFGDGVLKHLVTAVRRVMPSFLRCTMLEIGPLLSLGSSISHSPRVTDGRWRQIARMMVEYARRQDMSLMVFRDFSGPAHGIERALLQEGFKAFFNLPLAIMKVRWDSFDDYLSALKKPARSNVRRKLKRKQAHGIRTEITGDGLEHLDRRLELFQNVRSRSSRFNRDAVGEEYYRSMSANFKGHGFLVHYFHGDKLVAFAYFVKYRRQLITHYIGMDYDVSRRAALYSCCYCDLLRLAFDEGLESFDAGITTYESKSALGFSIIPQVMYVWMSSRMLSDAAAVLWRRMTSFDIQNCHHVFKRRRDQYIWDGRTRQPREAGELAR